MKCATYGIPAECASEVADLNVAIQKVLNHEGCCVLEIKTLSEQPIVPSVSSLVNSDGAMI
jgi:2-succinyl-5-enolpyruvyl-6-hydroxy-3-cyclohexene-1-carboxylate synthase